MRRLHLRDYIMALVAEKALTLNPREPMDVNFKKFVSAMRDDFKAVLGDIGENFAAHVVRAGGALGSRVLGDLARQLADKLTRR